MLWSMSTNYYDDDNSDTSNIHNYTYDHNNNIHNYTYDHRNTYNTQYHSHFTNIIINCTNSQAMHL